MKSVNTNSGHELDLEPLLTFFDEFHYEPHPAENAARGVEEALELLSTHVPPDGDVVRFNAVTKFMWDFRRALLRMKLEGREAAHVERLGHETQVA